MRAMPLLLLRKRKRVLRLRLQLQRHAVMGLKCYRTFQAGL
jgi:hypothetical protein